MKAVLYSTDYVLIDNSTGKMVALHNSDEIIIYGDREEAQEDATMLGNVQVVSCDKLSESDKEILRMQIILK